MPLIIGDDKIKSIYAGNEKIKKAYLGDELVYTSISKPKELGEWKLSTLPGNDWAHITFGDGVFVAVSSNDNIVAYSADGEYWAKSNIPAAPWYDVAYGDGRFVTVELSKTGVAYSTDKCKSWNQSQLPETTQGYYIQYGNDVFTTISYNTQYPSAYSENGNEWTLGNAVAESKYSTSSYDVFFSYGAGVFVVAPKSKNYVHISKNGIEWEMVQLAYTPNLLGMTYAKDRFIGLSNKISSFDGGNYYVIMQSKNGKEWEFIRTYQDSKIGLKICNLSYGNGILIGATDYADWFYYSDDGGLNWTKTSLSVNSRFRNIAYGNGRFVSVSSFGNQCVYSKLI